jgi:hypothetical protein
MTTIEVKLECLRKAIEIAPTKKHDENISQGLQYYNNSKNTKEVLELAEQFYKWVSRA